MEVETVASFAVAELPMTVKEDANKAKIAKTDLALNFITRLLLKLVRAASARTHGSDKQTLNCANQLCVLTAFFI